MNKSFKNMFKSNHLSIGIFSPIESYSGNIPKMKSQTRLIQKVEEYGFSAIWTRDIPLNDPSFGDVGQMYDPFIYLSYLASCTNKISLAIGSLILPFRHPINVAKSINSLNNLSEGRFILGVATGDRPVEYKAHNVDFENRGEIFRESMKYIDTLVSFEFPTIRNKLGSITNEDLLPKSKFGKVPILVTGHSQQSIEWISKNSDGWIYYPQNSSIQQKRIENWKDELIKNNKKFKPFIQSLYVDLASEHELKPTPIHLGYRLGRNSLIELLKEQQSIGINHIIINLKYCRREAESVIDELGKYVLPLFTKQLGD